MTAKTLIVMTLSALSGDVRSYRGMDTVCQMHLHLLSGRVHEPRLVKATAEPALQRRD